MKPLGTVPSAPITVGITLTFMFYSLFSSLARSKYFSLVSFSLIFPMWSAETAKSSCRQVYFFFVKSRLLCGDPFVLQIIIIIIIYSFRVFHISVSWWLFTGDWVTASLLKSPGLFSVFWAFSIMLLFGWSLLGRQLPNLPGPLKVL